MAYSIEMWHQISRTIKKGFGTLVETTCKRRMAPGKLRFRYIASSQAIFCVFVDSRYLGVKSALENRLLMVNGLLRLSTMQLTAILCRRTHDGLEAHRAMLDLSRACLLFLPKTTQS
jgi:hypothetical protein